jgi:hypothetical protein
MFIGGVLLAIALAIAFDRFYVWRNDARRRAA